MFCCNNHNDKHHISLNKAPLGNQAIHIIFRHGSRGPSKRALEVFNGTEIPDAWPPEFVEELTDKGAAQAESLGYFMGARLPTNCKVMWHSSNTRRTIESGQAFLRGMLQRGILSKGYFEIMKQSGPRKLDSNNPDVYYRAYMTNEEYMEAARKLRSGKSFADKAKKEKSVLAKLQPKIGETDTAEELDVVTYFMEIMECERYWDGNNDCSILSKRNKDSKEDISRLAWWCWNERFFRLAESKLLGREILRIIESGDYSEDDVVIHSAHDYTIMALLSALGYDENPVSSFGYCAYIVFDRECVRLNPEPFPFPDSLKVSIEKEIVLDKIH